MCRQSLYITVDIAEGKFMHYQSYLIKRLKYVCVRTVIVTTMDGITSTIYVNPIMYI